MNASISSIVVSFDEPISTSTPNATNIVVDGQMGLLQAASISEICDRTYQITFPTLTEDGPYHFTLLPMLLGTNDLPLDLNLNGTNGEPSDTVGLTLILDTKPPRITQHTPAGDVAGTVTNLDVWFSEPVDLSSLVSANARLTNSLGQTITVTSVREVGLNRYRLGFTSQTAVAQYFLSLNTNVADLAGNPLSNTAYVASFNLVPVDFQLSNVTPSTNQFWAGEPAGVSWQGRNVTGTPLVGEWIDAVYVSPDPVWNITDPLLGTVQHTGGLASNEVYSASLNFTVPGLLPGNYYLLVRADLGNQTRETVETNNFAVAGPIPVIVRELTIGGGYGGTLTTGSRFHYFAVQVPAGESLRLSLDGQGGVNHLFVNHASIPTRLNADMGGTAASADQSVTLTGIPGGGTYYILVSGEQIGSGGNPYSRTASTAPFYLDRVTPNQIAGGASRRFWVQSLESNQPAVMISGAGFDQATTVQFTRSNGLPVSPTRVKFLSPASLNVFLPTTTMPAGTYSVSVTKGIANRVLTNAFTVATNGEAKLEVRIVGTSLSPGGGQRIQVEYVNSGSRPMPTPLLKVTAYTNAVITTHKLNRRPQDRFRSLSSSGGNGGGGGRSWGSIPSYRFRVAMPLSTAQVMAVAPGPNPGILQPGARGIVPVYFEGLLQDRGEQSIRFSVGSLTADDTTMVNCGPPAPGIPDEIHFPRSGQRQTGSLFALTNRCPEFLFAPNWPERESDSAPETADAAGWHAVWLNVMTNAGPLWADYVITLGDSMNHLAKIGQITNDPAALFSFEVLQATAALNPVRTLAGAVDASAPSPGFPLVFRRVYGQPILSRYKPGPLARGWSHNWDISIQHLTNFQGVTVRGPGGADRFFGRYDDGSYTPTGNDTGQLTVSGGTFQLTEADKTIWVFSTNQPVGLLQYVQDANSNRITCGYSGALLTSLTHTSGKQLLLQYDGAGRLSQITDPLGPGAADDRVTTYEYDGSGEHLIRVTAPGNRVTTYAYHTAGIPQRLHALTNVTYPDLTQDSFAYDTQGRLQNS